MSGFNLPPGCSVSDIPGNRPEDLIAEQQADAVYAIVPDCTDEQLEKFFVLLAKEYENGYVQSRSDAAEEQYYKQLNEHEWRTIHNALASYMYSVISTESGRKTIQQLMNKVRDNYIAPYETNRPHDT